MNKVASFFALLVGMVIAGQAQPAGQGAGIPPAAQAAMKSIDAEKIRATVKYLADDKLQGRGTGQKGGDEAADWIAAQLKSYGLQPAGENGSFFQPVNFYGATTDGKQTHFAFVNKSGAQTELKFADEFVATDQTHSEKSEIDAPIVWVGYGIKAPEYNWDDYKGVDLKGKVVLMLVNEPPSDDPKFFKGRALTYYGRWTYKYEEAARRGAVAAILIHKTDMASYPWEVVRNSNSGEKSFLKSDAPQLKAAAWIQYDVARKLAQASAMDVEKMIGDANSRSFKPIPLPVKLKAHMVSKIRPFSSNNVVAMLPGSDPKLKDEAVMYTAHYDHLGIRPDMPGDNIYNGARDNATGCGIVLELARVFSQAQSRPKRSILFASVTAEEQGLLGSEYLGEHPPIPAGKISLDLNFDDIPPLGEPEEVEVSGAERTNFYPTVEAMAQEFRLAIRPDSHPEAGHYYRSDHFSLARVGVPSFSVNEGMKYKHHSYDWGMQQAEEYTNKQYHQPSDEYAPSMDFSGDAVMARFGFALGWAAASQPKVIGWQAGDEFEAARKQSQAH